MNYINTNTTTQVTCTDAGRISVGAVGPGASDQNAWFGSVAALLDGPLYESQVAKNAKHEAMTKVLELFFEVEERLSHRKWRAFSML